ncbi:MAG: hypothetical protein QOJ07_3076 [Thermoleophilaceae bacterium]|nr:hypothetical protein [Thermoleophilaceae bacterium]
MRRLALLLALACALVAGLAGAPSALAAYFPGEAVDGPTPDIDSVGGVALSRDGGGYVTYLKRDAGAQHVFVSLLANGVPRQPQRVDPGRATPSSQPRIAVSDGGRALAVWINGGSVYASLRPDGASSFGDPVAVYSAPAGAPASDPSLSMSTHGAGYVAFVAGGDVRAARLTGTTWTLLDAPLDINPAHTANQPDISASADGTAVAAFTEIADDGVPHVFVRRVVRTRLSNVPQDAGAGSLDGVPGGAADSPSIDIEDDSTYVWLAFRQDYGGVSRVVARRLIGSALDAPVAVDDGATGAESPSFDMTGKGRGLVGLSVRGSNQPYGAPLVAGDVFSPATQLAGGSGDLIHAVAAISENGRGSVAWQQADDGVAPTIQARYYNARFWEGSTTISAPDFGTPDASRGLYAAADGGGNQAIAFVQDSSNGRTVEVAVFDKEPRTTGGSNRSTWSQNRRPSFTWSKIEDSWGEVQYRIDIDGVPQAVVTGSRWTPPADLPDGAHVWDVVAVDSRGQASIGPDRAIRVDTTKPTVTLTGGRSKKGRPAPIGLTALDGAAIAGSGVGTVTMTFGDGTRSGVTVPTIGMIDGQKIGHRYTRPGSYTVRVVVTDKAGNQTVAKTQVRVTK